MTVVCRRLHDDPVEMRWVAGVPVQMGAPGPAGYVCPECGAQVPSPAVAASVRAYQDGTVTVLERSGRLRTTQRANLR
jgi:hypothetical protein